jgi:hypothetical protein
MMAWLSIRDLLLQAEAKSKKARLESLQLQYEKGSLVCELEELRQHNHRLTAQLKSEADQVLSKTHARAHAHTQA